MKKLILLGFVLAMVAACTTPMREHHMTRHHNHCNEWQHHDHDDLHGGSYWHTHCMDKHK